MGALGPAAALGQLRVILFFWPRLPQTELLGTLYRRTFVRGVYALMSSEPRHPPRRLVNASEVGELRG